MITLPTIHSNGTSRVTLQRDYDAAAEALETFAQAWTAIEFNARDYYPQGESAWTNARQLREEHSANLRQIHKYLETIREHLYS